MRRPETQEKLFQRLQESHSRWVSRRALLRAAWPYWYQGGRVDDGLQQLLRRGIYRLRKRLAGTDFVIENDVRFGNRKGRRFGCAIGHIGYYRLVQSVPTTKRASTVGTGLTLTTRRKDLTDGAD